MKALISPAENNRIVQFEPDDQIFPVAPLLFWATCPNDCTVEWTYNDGDFIPPVSE